jgi:hypothetical protein
LIIDFLQGKGAPKEINVDTLTKVGKLKINCNQRAPYKTAAIQDDPERYEVAKDILADVLHLSHDNVSHYTP